MKLTRGLLMVPVAFALCTTGVAGKDKGKEQKAEARQQKATAAKDDKEWKRATEGHRPQDLNGDGVITRNEWPGNDVSFQELDRDKDGALTSKDRGQGAEG